MTGQPTTTAAMVARRGIREARWRAAADLLNDVAKEYQCDIMAMRSKPFSEEVQCARVAFMKRANGFIGCDAIADLLHCDESTVRYHINPNYQQWKRATNNERGARSRAASRENLRPD
jgi:hypothetical protein